MIQYLLPLYKQELLSFIQVEIAEAYLKENLNLTGSNFKVLKAHLVEGESIYELLDSLILPDHYLLNRYIKVMSNVEENEELQLLALGKITALKSRLKGKSGKVIIQVLEHLFDQIDNQSRLVKLNHLQTDLVLDTSMLFNSPLTEWNTHEFPLHAERQGVDRGPK